MEEILKGLAGNVAMCVEAAAALFIAIGAVQAVFQIVKYAFSGTQAAREKKSIWLGFASWLVLALEFELAADILRSAISPSWTDIGQLGVIAVIRTFLNYFLEDDI